MRNGNYIARASLDPHLGRSYPTYEEWKQNSHISASVILPWFLSYLWGMETDIIQRFHRLCCLHVLILPMRNGNSFFSTRLQLIHYVLILPMRNGNLFRVFQLSLQVLIVLILPMRNGNFSSTLELTVNSNVFLSYLWGMETPFIHGCQPSFPLFLSYLWGMETH